MQSNELKAGQFYAYRQKRQPGHPILKVKLLALVGRGGRVQIRFEDGDFPRLVEYGHTRQLVVPWGERKALVQDEERMEQIKGLERQGTDDAIETAIEAVLEATGSRALGPKGPFAISWEKENPA